MSLDAIRKQLDAEWAKEREELVKVMEEAPDDSIIASTEWHVRAIHQALAQKCFQLMVQSKVDRLDQTPQGVFSPGGAIGIDAARGAASQRGFLAGLPDHQRRGRRRA